jgi:hypothetical protein
MADASSFEVWMSAVDRIVVPRLGVPARDLPNLRLRDAFDAGVSPEAFCEQALGMPPVGVLDDDRGARGVFRLLLELLFG